MSLWTQPPALHPCTGPPKKTDHHAHDELQLRCHRSSLHSRNNANVDTPTGMSTTLSKNWPNDEFLHEQQLWDLNGDLHNLRLRTCTTNNRDIDHWQ